MAPARHGAVALALFAVAPAWALVVSAKVHGQADAASADGAKVESCLKAGLGPGTEWLIEPRWKGADFKHMEFMQRRGANATADKETPLWVLHNQRVASQMKPTAVVFARNLQDVKVAATCAHKAGLSVSGQSGRSSYIAYCTGRCVLVNLHHLTDYSIDSAAEMAVLGGGMNLGQVYARLDEAGFTIPAGTIPSVGLGGLTLGGGKGPLIRLSGLTIDQLRGVDVVLGDGTVVHANQTHEPDLLWLAQGGGGGTFPGVVTAFHFHLVRSPKVMTEFYAQWDMVRKPGAKGEAFDVVPAIRSWKVWQEEYLMHPDPRVWVRLEIHPYKEPAAQSKPYISMAFKFIGMTREEAEPLLAPAIKELGQPRNGGEWSSDTYINSLVKGAGIGRVSRPGCKQWDQGLTMEEAQKDLLKDKNFCSWDAGFDAALKHRGMVMKKLSDEAIEAMMNLVLEAPYFDPTLERSWYFYLQVDPTNGFAGEVDPKATAYPWREADGMTMQVIAKWTPDVTSYTLKGFNKLVVSTLQPYVGVRAFYDYPDEDMPGGAVPLFSFFGDNAPRVLGIRAKYAHIPLDEGTRWTLEVGRAGMDFGMQPWSKPVFFDVVSDPAKQAGMMAEAIDTLGLDVSR